MARRILSVVVVAQILIEWHAGRSIREVAGRAGVTPKTVRRYVARAGEADPAPASGRSAPIRGGRRCGSDSHSSTIRTYASRPGPGSRPTTTTSPSCSRTCRCPTSTGSSPTKPAWTRAWPACAATCGRTSTRPDGADLAAQRPPDSARCRRPPASSDLTASTSSPGPVPLSPHRSLHRGTPDARRFLARDDIGGRRNSTTGR
jgi:hypothetical protein